MKKIALIFSFFFSIALSGQNLVPNPSFENYDTCGGAWYPISNAIGWTGTETPDYFNSCVIPSGGFVTDVPVNFLGYQMPFEGNAYGGIVTYNAYNFREFIQIKLVQKLSSNKYYCVNFNVSLGDTSRWAIDKLGAYFSPTILSPEPYQAIPSPPYSIFTFYTPQIESSSLLNDTSNWSSIGGVFQANGTEEYVAIGNFRDDNGTDTVRIQNSNAPVAYYYIDNVSTEEVLSADAGTDSYFTLGDSIQLGNNPTENATYSWFPTIGLNNPNAANPKAAPTTSTTYILTKTQCNVTTTDTVTLTQSGVGINENGTLKPVKLFPNPNDGNFQLQIELKGNESGTLEIYDITGNLSNSYPLAGGIKALSINAETLKGGMYQFNIVVNGKSCQKGKLIVIK